MATGGRTGRAGRGRWAAGLLALLLAGLLLLGLWRLRPQPATPQLFSGDRAYAHVLAQMRLGPRVVGTEADTRAGDYIYNQLQQAGWSAEFQAFQYQNTPVRNVIGRANVGKGPIVIVGAHYDSRRRADQDPQHPDVPVPGANDGAPGVAVLLELARVLDLRQAPNEIWLAFFDAEDDGDLGDGWDWLVGSSYMAAHLTVQPRAMILLDMVGDADQQFYYEQTSDPALMRNLWATAAGLGYSQYFIPTPRWSMLDDHTPFLQRGIPAVDVIDFDYGPNNSYWHTTLDTADKVSAASLEHVGRTMAAFLQSGVK
jgi:glutaminyl-peptide cyclotransferase